MKYTSKLIIIMLALIIFVSSPVESLGTDQSNLNFLSAPINQTISPDVSLKLVWIVNPTINASYSIFIEQLNFERGSLINGTVENGIVELLLFNLPTTQLIITLEIYTVDEKITSIVEILVFDPEDSALKELFTYFSSPPMIIITLFAIFVKFKFMNNTRK